MTTEEIINVEFDKAEQHAIARPFFDGEGKYAHHSLSITFKELHELQRKLIERLAHQHHGIS